MNHSQLSHVVILICKSLTKQDTHVSPMHNGAFSSERFFSGVVESLPIMSSYSGLLQSLKGGTDPHLNAFSKHLSSPNGDISWHMTEKHGGKLLAQSMMAPERKRSRNIGSKGKRLVIDSQDALELKLTWEEVQDMLRPPPSVKPSTVTVEDYEFEEYEVSHFLLVKFYAILSFFLQLNLTYII